MKTKSDQDRMEPRTAEHDNNTKRNQQHIEVRTESDVAKKRRRLVQYNLFGDEIVWEEPRRPSDALPLDFEGAPMNLVNKNGCVWFKALDACEIAGLANVSQALSRLDDDQKRDDLISNDVTGRSQKMWFVNESGLYTLLLSGRLRKASPQYEKVKRFRRWVTDVVLPAIRKTGTYSMKPKTRADRETLRLKCDPATAKVRCEQFAMNLGQNLRLAAEGSTPNDHKEYHNSGYRGICEGMEAKDLRRQLQMKRGTPLDRMDAVPMTINLSAKALVDKLAKQARENGKPMSFSEQAKLLETVSRELTELELKRFGPEAKIGFTEDPRRGLILDVVQRQLSA